VGRKWSMTKPSRDNERGGVFDWRDQKRLSTVPTAAKKGGSMTITGTNKIIKMWAENSTIGMLRAMEVQAKIMEGMSSSQEDNGSEEEELDESD